MLRISLSPVSSQWILVNTPAVWYQAIGIALSFLLSSLKFSFLLKWWHPIASQNAKPKQTNLIKATALADLLPGVWLARCGQCDVLNEHSVRLSPDTSRSIVGVVSVSLSLSLGVCVTNTAAYLYQHTGARTPRTWPALLHRLSHRHLLRHPIQAASPKETV